MEKKAELYTSSEIVNRKTIEKNNKSELIIRKKN